MSLNRVTLIGHTGKDPDVRTLDGGIKVASLSFATTDKAYTLPNGTQVPERTEWHNLILWNKTAELTGQALHNRSFRRLHGDAYPKGETAGCSCSGAVAVTTTGARV